MIVDQAFEGGAWFGARKGQTWEVFKKACKDHVKINARILGNATTLQRRNDQKVVNRVCAKAQCEWDNLVIVAQ
jgi:hypothetical protein